MRSLRLLAALLIPAICVCQTTSPAKRDSASSRQFNGEWWTTVTSDEQAGFINGLSDCLTWSAYKSGFNGTPEQLVPKVSHYYAHHPQFKDLSVLDVWQRVSGKLPQAPSSVPGETWSNPHWYLDAGWWGGNNHATNEGFVEGYLWCMRTQNGPPTETYSRSDGYYTATIDAFVKHNPKSNRRSVAAILAQYSDLRADAPQ